MWKLKVSNFKNTENSWKHDDKNSIEEHEDSEIVKDFSYHCYDITHVLKYSKEEEGLDENENANKDKD